MESIQQNKEQMPSRSNPVEWLTKNTGFEPYQFQAQFLTGWWRRLRVVRKARQIGMTRTISEEAIWAAFNLPNEISLIMSPSDRQSKIVIDRISATIESHEELRRRTTTFTKSEIVTDINHRVISLPNSPDRARGDPANRVYLDEAAHFLNDEPLLRAVQPMLVATHGTLTLNSTPFGKRGIFWERYNFALEQSARNNEVMAYDFYPSTINPLITLEDLAREKFQLIEPEYLQEYCGQFIEEVDTYIPMSIITPCIEFNPAMLMTVGDPKKSYYMGVDYGKARDETVVTIGEKIPVVREDGTTVKILCVRYLVAWAGMDYGEQIGRIAELKKKFRITKCCDDQSGVGEAVHEDLKKVVPNTEGVLFSQQKKVDLAGGLRVLFEKELIRIPNNQRLIQQVNGLRYEVSKLGNILFYTPPELKAKVHDDYAWSLALMAFAARGSELVVQDLFE